MTRSAAPALPTSTAASSSGVAIVPPAFRRDGGADIPVGGLVLLATLLGIAGWAWLRRWRLGAAGAVAWPSLPWRPEARRSAAGTAPPALHVVASRRLDGNARVHVLAVGEHRYLVGCNGQHGIHLLACLDAGGSERAAAR